MTRFATRTAWIAVSTCVMSACASSPHPRTQHVVDGEVVSSSPPSPNEYAAYVRVRVALETPGADLKRARKDMTVLLAREPNDPQLWVTKAELEHLAGDAPAAQKALARALELQPNYGPALALRSEIDSGRVQLEAARGE